MPEAKSNIGVFPPLVRTFTHDIAVISAAGRVFMRDRGASLLQNTAGFICPSSGFAAGGVVAPTIYRVSCRKFITPRAARGHGVFQLKIA